MPLADPSRMADLFDEAADTGAAARARPDQAPPGGVRRPDDLLVPGQVLGKAEVVRPLGKGGMGTVYLARHLTLDKSVALKVLPAKVARDKPDFAERFLREARLAARLDHPNVVGILDADQDPASGMRYIVMEYVDGGSLSDLLKEQGRLPERRALELVAGVAEALQVASEHSVVHRDIKPANVMLTRDGRVKLADLGLAKALDDQGDLTQAGVALGTPAYMSPEQIADTRRVDARADVYALGVTLFQLLSGALPFRGSSSLLIIRAVLADPVPDPRDLRGDLRREVADLVMRMLAKEPAERPADAAALLVELRGLLQPQRARRSSDSGRARRSSGRASSSSGRARRSSSSGRARRGSGSGWGEAAAGGERRGGGRPSAADVEARRAERAARAARRAADSAGRVFLAAPAPTPRPTPRGSRWLVTLAALLAPLLAYVIVAASYDRLELPPLPFQAGGLGGAAPVSSGQ